jgi:hypothetical protein
METCPGTARMQLQAYFDILTSVWNCSLAAHKYQEVTKAVEHVKQNISVIQVQFKEIW